MSRLSDILLEIEAKQQAQTSLAAYAERCLEVVPALHHRLICDNIDQLLQDDFDELIILAPPGSAKSTYTSIALSSYFIGRWPDKAILTCSYSTELAEKWGRRVRNQASTPIHRALFPDCQLSKDSLSAGRWATTLNGEFYAAGVGSGILGFRADLGVIDDPISGFEQAQSITQLAKVHSWYETDFITRLKPKGKVVLICQRLARNDLAGYLIDRNASSPTRRQRVLTLKMEAEGDPTTPDPLDRAPGERLWPEWFTPEMVIDAKRDPYKWRTLYQQSPPSDSGEWVTPDLIRILPPELTPHADSLRFYLVSDLALSINKGDYSVHVVVGVDADLNMYVWDAWRSRCAVEDTAEQHIRLALEYGPSESLIDDDNASKVYMPLLARMCRERAVVVPYKALPLRGQDKETRAAPLRGWFRRGKVWLRQGLWNDWLKRQLLLFPNGTQDGDDDAVDALSLMGRRLMSLSSKTVPAPPPPPKTLYDMTLDELHEERNRTSAYSRARI